MNMPVFVIGLPRFPDRHQAALARLKDAGIDAQFFAGVDLAGGDTLAPDERVFKYKRLLILGLEATLGDAGCYFAHYRILKHILSLGLERAVVMECDAVPGPGLKSLLEQIARLDVEKYELIYLFHRDQGKPAWAFFRRQGGVRFEGSPEYALRFLYGPCGGTVAYVITRDAARRLLPQLVPMRAPIDSVLGKPYLNGLRAYIVTPQAVDHTECAPSIIKQTSYYGPANPMLARLDRYFCTAVKPLARRWRRVAKLYNLPAALRRRVYVRRHKTSG